MARKFKELVDRMPAASRDRVRQRVDRLVREMPLEELRAARSLTQEQLATILKVKQASISKLESRTDMYVSTLRNVIRAMGGDLEIRAVFPDSGTVVISGFGELEKR